MTGRLQSLEEKQLLFLAINCKTQNGETKLFLYSSILKLKKKDFVVAVMSRCCIMSYTAGLKHTILLDTELGKCGLCCHSENCVSGFQDNIPQKPSGKIDSVIWMLISRCSEALVSFYSPTSDLRKKQRSLLFVIHSFLAAKRQFLPQTFLHVFHNISLG